MITDGQHILRDRAFINGRGFLLVDYANKTLWRDTEILANVPAVVPVNTEQFTRSEFYAGTETIFGRTAYHMTYKNADGAVTEELWFIPELGAVRVKSVVYRAPGVLASVEDAVSLEVGEPDRSLLKLPDFPEAERAKNKK